MVRGKLVTQAQIDDANAPRYTLQEIRKALHLPSSAPTTKDLQREDFSNKSRVHDWRNYVADHRWGTMSDLERLLDYAQAYYESQREEWD